MDIKDLDNRFAYHKPDLAKGNTHSLIRDLCSDLAEKLNVLVPEGREKSLAITKLEEVMFWSNASIARND